MKINDGIMFIGASTQELVEEVSRMMKLSDVFSMKEIVVGKKEELPEFGVLDFEMRPSKRKMAFVVRSLEVPSDSYVVAEVVFGCGGYYMFGISQRKDARRQIFHGGSIEEFNRDLMECYSLYLSWLEGLERMEENK